MAAKAATNAVAFKFPQCFWMLLARFGRLKINIYRSKYKNYSAVSSTGNDDALCKFQWLKEFSRGIPVQGENVRIYTEPREYYALLEERTNSCKERIKLSSLYLGTGELEQRLVRQVDERIIAKKDLSCHFLLDCLRGTRGHPSSCTLLQPLLAKHPQAVKLSLYHTPDFRGLLKQVFPARFNEGVGLQHMKVYVFDDTVIISGANLSESYFTNRQDRCIEFSNSKELADFYSLLLEIVCDHSFSVGADGTLHPPPVGINPLLTHSKSEQFKRSLKHHVEDALLPSNAADVGSASTRLGGCDTVVYPLVQMGQIGFRQDEIVTERLFASFEAGSTAFLASGYFNIPQTYTDILMSSLNNWNILAASPKANGFYGAKGVAGHVPSMYVYFASQFLKKTFESSKQNNIKYFEYYRPNWTFHGKGLWFYPKSSPLPLVSLVGSSNFGCRSLLHDLETQALIVTENTSLRRALHEECRRLFEYSSCVSYEQAMEREIHWLEKMATILLANRV